MQYFVNSAIFAGYLCIFAAVLIHTNEFFALVAEEAQIRSFFAKKQAKISLKPLQKTTFCYIIRLRKFVRFSK